MDGFVGSPDFRMGWTRECFQDSGTSDKVRLELTKCRSTSPIDSKQDRSMWMVMPSSPQADEPLIPRMVARRSASDNGIKTNEQAPTRGRRHETSASPLVRLTSSATRGPTPTKNRLSSSAVTSGSFRAPFFFATIGSISRHMDLCPPSRRRWVTSSRQSRLMADRTARLASRYSGEA